MLNNDLLAFLVVIFMFSLIYFKNNYYIHSLIALFITFQSASTLDSSGNISFSISVMLFAWVVVLFNYWRCKNGNIQ